MLGLSSILQNIRFGEAIEKQIIKFLLQRYVGQFLEEELSVDQLTVEIISGTGIIKHLTLNVNSVNDIAEQLNLPFKFVDGFIGEICLSVPWKRLMQENSFVEITGLVLTLHPKQRAEDVSLVDSMINSMSTSMQIAHECLSQVEAQTGDNIGNFYTESAHNGSSYEDESNSSEAAGLSAGLEALQRFAQAIDTVFNRTKVRFIDSIIRLEYAPNTGKSGVALEIKINKVDYFDEAGLGLGKDGTDGSEKKDSSKSTSPMDSYTAKKFLVEGVTLYTDEYSTVKCKSDDGRLDRPTSIPNEVHQNGKFNTFINTSIDYSDPRYLENDLNACTFNLHADNSDPILCAKLYGCQEIKVRLRQNDTVNGPKVHIEGNCGSLMAFFSPRQIHLISEFIDGFVFPEEVEKEKEYNAKRNINKSNQKPMDQFDFHKVEHELMKNLSPANKISSHALGQAFEQGWSGPPEILNDDEFLPVNNGKSNNMSSSFKSEMTDLNSSYISSASGYLPNCINSNPCSKNIKAENEVHMSFKVRLNSIGLVVIHEDILLPSFENNESLAKASVIEMQSKSKEFFSCVGNIWHSDNSYKEFVDLKEKLKSACSVSNIQIISCPLTADGTEISHSNKWERNTGIIFGWCEVVENLYGNGINQNISSLLSFNKAEPQVHSKFSLPVKPKAQLSVIESQNITIAGKSRRRSIPKIEVKIILDDCACEVDVSIIDRINTLLNKQTIINRKDLIYSPDLPHSRLENHMLLKGIIDDENKPETKFSLLLSSSSLNLKLFIPIPDLRPLTDMGRIPWWKRNVRKETLLFTFDDFRLENLSCPSVKFETYEIRCSVMLLQLQLDEGAPPISIARATVCQGTEKGFDPVRIVCDIYPTQPFSDLEDKEPKAENLMSKSMMGFLDLKGDNAYSLFSKRNVASKQSGKFIEITMPADKEERNRFIDNCLENVQFKVDIHLPEVQLILPSKHIYEVLYNRLISDLLLWAPSAPSQFNKAQVNLTDVGFDSEFTNKNFQYFVPFNAYNSFQNDQEDTSSYFPSEGLQNQDEFEYPISSEEPVNGQSLLCASVFIGKLTGSIKTPYKDVSGKVIPENCGEVMLSARDSFIFTTAGYKGSKDQCYTCITADKVYVYHEANEKVMGDYYTLGSLSPKNMKAVLFPCDSLNKMKGGDKPEYTNAETLIICIETNFDTVKNEKVFALAGDLNYSTVRHYMSITTEHWSSQLSDMFNVEDYPIKGYFLPEVVTEMNFHFTNCSIDYRPLNLAVRSFITIDTLSISSNLALMGDSSVLLIFIEDAGLFLSQNLNSKKVCLKKDYVCVGNIEVLEICMKVQEDKCGNPSQELTVSNNNIHIQTCADSCKMLMELLIYLANEGDLVKEADGNTTFENNSKKVVLHPSESKGSIYSPTLGKSSEISEITFLENMLQDAMMEKSPEKANLSCNSLNNNPNRKQVNFFHFPDESSRNLQCSKGLMPTKPGTDIKYGVLHESFVPDTEQALTEASQAFTMDDSDNSVDVDFDNEFCILDEIPGSGIKLLSGRPNFEISNDDKFVLAEDNFLDGLALIEKGCKVVETSPIFKINMLPINKYNLQELTVVWHIYGGNDFQSDINTSVGFNAKDKNGNQSSYQNDSGSFGKSNYYKSQNKFKASTVSFYNGEATIHSENKDSSFLTRARLSHKANLEWYAAGGPGRCHDILMDFQLSKVRFQYTVYPRDSKVSCRYVFTINDIEIRDRLKSSEINKFLYQFSSESCPRQAQANMFHLKAVTTRNDLIGLSPETVVRVALQPIKLNIDQDSLIFLVQFFGSLISVDKDSEIGEEEIPYYSKTPYHAPVITVNVENMPMNKDRNDKNIIEGKELNLEFEEERKESLSTIYFKSFIFSYDVPIRIDYHGKHVDINSQYGPVAGLVIGLGQLNHSVITLKRVEFLNGVLGVNKLITSVTNEWLSDIRQNQLPSILGGVGPMHSFVQLFGGFKNLIWLPIEQYNKDGRVFRGLQRGTSAFTTSSAYAILDLSSRFVGCIQSAAETMYDMVSSGPSVRNKSYKKLNRKPQDIREGVTTAYGLVRHGLGDTANTIWQAAAEEHAQKGVSGAVGGVLRQIVPAVFQPIIIASEATKNVIGGMTNQLVPNARKEAADKWKS